MMSDENNYAFIDTQNLVLGVKKLGWNIDYVHFRKFLKQKYSIQKAYIFVGYVESQSRLYQFLTACGFIVIFKKIIYKPAEKIKGNCDVDLTLRVCIDFWNFDRAVLVTGDGDFYSLVLTLQSAHKFKALLVPHRENCSSLYRDLSSEEKIYIEDYKETLIY